MNDLSNSIITPARLVDVVFPPGQDPWRPSANASEPTSAVGLCVSVDEDGSANMRVFRPDGASDLFLTGLRHRSVVTAAKDAGGNLPFWDWPKRV